MTESVHNQHDQEGRKWSAVADFKEESLLISKANKESQLISSKFRRMLHQVKESSL